MNLVSHTMGDGISPSARSYATCCMCSDLNFSVQIFPPYQLDELLIGQIGLLTPCPRLFRVLCLACKQTLNISSSENGRASHEYVGIERFLQRP